MDRGLKGTTNREGMAMLPSRIVVRWQFWPGLMGPEQGHDILALFNYTAPEDMGCSFAPATIRLALSEASPPHESSIDRTGSSSNSGFRTSWRWMSALNLFLLLYLKKQYPPKALRCRWLPWPRPPTRPLGSGRCPPPASDMPGDCEPRAVPFPLASSWPLSAGDFVGQ